jgi:hypothetical protein
MGSRSRAGENQFHEVLGPDGSMQLGHHTLLHVVGLVMEDIISFRESMLSTLPEWLFQEGTIPAVSSFIGRRRSRMQGLGSRVPPERANGPRLSTNTLRFQGRSAIQALAPKLGGVRFVPRSMSSRVSLSIHDVASRTASSVPPIILSHLVCVPPAVRETLGT